MSSGSSEYNRRAGATKGLREENSEDEISFEIPHINDSDVVERKVTNMGGDGQCVGVNLPNNHQIVHKLKQGDSVLVKSTEEGVLITSRED